jgi:hypothetical protein
MITNALRDHMRKLMSKKDVIGFLEKLIVLDDDSRLLYSGLRCLCIL